VAYGKICGSNNEREAGFQARIDRSDLQSECDREYQAGRDRKRANATRDRFKEIPQRVQSKTFQCDCCQQESRHDDKQQINGVRVRMALKPDERRGSDE
jgi:hypothetical protein